MESEEDKNKAQITIEVVKSLVVEHVKREMPERVRKTLKNPSKPLRLDEVVDMIKEEDEGFKEERKNEEGWTRVSKQPPRRQEYRPQREYRQVQATSNKKWTPREDKPSNGNRRYEQDNRDSRRCYQCRERGHIARFCPYLQRPSGFRERGEPMEVNVADLVREYDMRRKGYVWMKKGTSSGSSGKDRTYSSSDEEGRKSSRDRASRSGDEKWQKKKKTYSAAAQQGKIEEERGPSGGHPPLALGRQGTRAGHGGGRSGACRWVQSDRPRGTHAAAQRAFVHPGLNSAEGGIGGWESLPNPNDPGIDGRAAVPTSADASTPTHLRLGKKSYRVWGETDGEQQTGVQIITEGTLQQKTMESFYDVTYKLSITDRVRHSIDLINGRTVYVKPGRYPVAFREIIKEHIKEMLETGVIRESVSTYNSPLWVVPKKLDKSGVQKYRVVVDYRELNKRTKSEKYPLPRLEEMLDRMTRSKVFSIIDLKLGYHQIMMEPRDIDKTAFQFERGKYGFTRMPFGLKNAPTTFQKMIDEFLVGLSEDFMVQAYMDDLIKFSKTLKEHENHLGKVKRRLQEFGLKISADKSSFFLPEVRFMGHIVSEQGTRPDPGKVQAVKELPEPTNLKGLMSFLGMVNFYRRFINGLADKVEPMTKLLKKNTIFQFDDKAKEAFNWCKNALSTVPILQFPDFEKRFILTTDASQFAIKTDNKPLVWIERLEETSARISRWKETLAAYDFEIVHTKGSENVVADCLSRQVNAIEEIDREYADRFLRDWLGESSEGSEPESEDPWGFEPLPEVRDGQTNRQLTEENSIINDKRRLLIFTVTNGDEVVTRSHRYGRTTIVRVIVGRDITDENLKETLEQLTEDWKVYHLHVTNESLNEKIKRWYEGMTTTPNATMVMCKLGWDTKSPRPKVRFLPYPITLFRISDKGRSGQRPFSLCRVCARVRVRGIAEDGDAGFYWLGMERTVAEQLALCEACARAKYVRIPEEPPQMVTPTPKKPLEVVVADVVFLDGTIRLTMIDRLTRFAASCPPATKTGEQVKEALLLFLAIVDTPGTLVLDQGREFRNFVVRGFLEEFHISVHWTTPGHSRSHGMIERLHSTLLEHLHLLRIGRGIDGDEAWARALLAYNSSVHSATGRTPLELMRSWQQTDPPVPVLDECEGLVEADEHRKIERVDRANEKATDRWDRVRVGDHVFLRNWYRRRKSDPRFVGLYLVASKLSRFRLRVRDSASGRTRLVHVRETRPPSARRRVQCRDPAIGRVNSDSDTQNPVEDGSRVVPKEGPMLEASSGGIRILRSSGRFLGLRFIPWPRDPSRSFILGRFGEPFTPEFEDKDYGDRLMAEIISRIQGPDENFVACVVMLKKYFLRFTSLLTERKKLHILKRGVIPYFYERIWVFDSNTVEECLERDSPRTRGQSECLPTALAEEILKEHIDKERESVGVIMRSAKQIWGVCRSFYEADRWVKGSGGPRVTTSTRQGEVEPRKKKLIRKEKINELKKNGEENMKKKLGHPPTPSTLTGKATGSPSEEGALGNWRGRGQANVGPPIRRRPYYGETRRARHAHPDGHKTTANRAGARHASGILPTTYGRQRSPRYRRIAENSYQRLTAGTTGSGIFGLHGPSLPHRKPQLNVAGPNRLPCP
ncbi:hypothetical protein AAG570_008398 [Ranatra chinensis]|uniref:Reverse transcriptase n=1 Tax=Ranatra chinensis TaxID=642074 RepID=A0ABD0YSY5_9HEMI